MKHKTVKIKLVKKEEERKERIGMCFLNVFKISCFSFSSVCFFFITPMWSSYPNAWMTVGQMMTRNMRKLVVTDFWVLCLGMLIILVILMLITLMR